MTLKPDFRNVRFPCSAEASDALSVRQHESDDDLLQLHFLSESLRPNRSQHVLLDADQVDELHARLGEWLKSRRPTNALKWWNE